MSRETGNKADLADALESVLGPIDTQEAAFAAIEAVCQALGARPATDRGAVEDAREAVELASLYDDQMAPEDFERLTLLRLKYPSAEAGKR